NNAKGITAPANISSALLNEMPVNKGCRNLKYALMASPKIVHQRIERPVWCLENNAHIGGPYSEQPVTAPTLNTISTIPPADGTIRATKIVIMPNITTAVLATNINCFGLVSGLT